MPDDLDQTDADLAWYVVHTNPRCEHRAELGLRQKGYSTLLPTYRAMRTRSRQREEVKLVLFPRYLFVGLQPGRQSFYPIGSVDGVKALLRERDGRPIAVPPDVMGGLRMATMLGVFDELSRAKPVGLGPGDQVRMIGGPFREHVGRIRAAPSEKRIEVLLSLFGRQTVVVASLADLERL